MTGLLNPPLTPKSSEFRRSYFAIYMYIICVPRPRVWCSSDCPFKFTKKNRFCLRMPQNASECPTLPNADLFKRVVTEKITIKIIWRTSTVTRDMNQHFQHRWHQTGSILESSGCISPPTTLVREAVPPRPHNIRGKQASRTCRPRRQQRSKL